MAIVTLRDQKQTLKDTHEITTFLSQFGIWFRRFEGSDSLPEHPSNEEILAAYDAPIQQLKDEGGYVTADVINITPDLDGLQTMLNKFSKEHWHEEDEIRFIVHGSGLFHIHPKDGPVFSIEVVKGDMINVPAQTHHWFDLCDEKRIRAIRLFKDKAGWVPHYTESGQDALYQPLCFGPSYIPPSQ